MSLSTRLAVMVLLVAGLVGASARTRRLPPGQPLTVWVNLLFFVLLGAADEWLLGQALDRWPLARASTLAGETLVLGWFFSPGREKPASKTLFFAHIGPFFAAVFGGALSVTLVRRWWVRES